MQKHGRGTIRSGGMGGARGAAGDQGRLGHQIGSMAVELGEPDRYLGFRRLVGGQMGRKDGGCILNNRGCKPL